MRISTKGRYALRMLIDLAEHENEGFIPLKDISERQNISKKYLEQIIPVLNREGILRRTRGPQGGYKLAVTPDRLTVGTILRATEGSLSPVDCVDQDEAVCVRRIDCPTFPIWRGLAKVINEYLDHITLQDILDQQQEKSNDYVI
ncbi:MAG: Rrf2 family transcriptional regulator [Clostridia bacterium]|nr:Rrf2 family transcriptional regulator [Clostridia bacterium]MBQ7727017.1 Rrf2 family transcriptional regulator [Clostridia bacterium]